MNSPKHYEFECLEIYYGGVKEVKRAIEDCPCCGEKLALSHFSDAGALLIHETARCPMCDYEGRKIIHSMN